MALFGHKMCDLCNKSRATIKLTRIDDDGELNELLICQACASEKSPLHKKTADSGQGLQGLFANLMKQKGAVEAGALAEPSIICDACGTSFEMYRKTFLLGCPTCYRAFADGLMTDLRKVHGDTHHRGKAPRGQVEEVPEEPDETVALRRQLREAVEQEDFEAAARLRDQIRALGGQGRSEDE